MRLHEAFKIQICWYRQRKSVGFALEWNIGLRPYHMLRWDVLKPLQSAMHQNRLRCIFRYVGNLAPDLGISQLFIVRFSKDCQQNDGHLINVHVICDSRLSFKYSICHCTDENQRRVLKDSIVSSRPATSQQFLRICDDLRWTAMLQEAQNRKTMANFIAMCGRALSLHPGLVKGM